MLKDAYSPFKAVHHPEILRGIKNNELPYPAFVQIDLTNACNHSCQYCFYRGSKTGIELPRFKNTEFIHYLAMLDIIDSMVECGVKAVEYTGGGEPTLHPYFKEIISYTINSGLEFSVISNGSTLDKFSQIFRKAAWVRFSVDAGTEKTWKLYHQPKNGLSFNYILHNIRLLADRKPKTMVLGFSFIITPINYNEIYKAAEIAKNIGMDNIRFSVAYTSSKDTIFRKIGRKINHEIARAAQLEDGKFKVFSFHERIFDLSVSRKSYSSCGFQHFCGVIGADMKLYPCCTLKYRNNTVIGDLSTNSFKDEWRSSQRKKWLGKFVCHSINCWMDRKNEFIEYILKKDALHRNFI